MTEKEILKREVKDWILYLDNKINLDSSIVAINFDIAESYTLYIVGSSYYDHDDEDWPCDDELGINSYLQVSKFLDTELNWEEYLDLIVTIFKELVQELDIELFSVEHIATGFVSGNLVTIK